MKATLFIGLYRDVWIAAIASSRKSLATQTAAICVRFQGRRVRHEYITMHITFLTRKSALLYRRGLRQRVASLTLDCNGVICSNERMNDRRMNMKIKGKVYRTVVRPSLMYGAETWALKKAQEKKFEVAEMRMLRWMCGVTKLDKIRNERIRGTTKVGEITKKVQERMLKWYGHVMRREEHYVGRRALVMKVQGRRKRGRPKRDGWTK